MYIYVYIYIYMYMYLFVCMYVCVLWEKEGGGHYVYMLYGCVMHVYVGMRVRVYFLNGGICLLGCHNGGGGGIF